MTYRFLIVRNIGHRGYVLFRRGFANSHVYTIAAFSSIRAVEGAQSVIHIGGDRSHHVPLYRAYPNDLGLDESGSNG